MTTLLEQTTPPIDPVAEAWQTLTRCAERTMADARQAWPSADHRRRAVMIAAERMRESAAVVLATEWENQ